MKKLISFGVVTLLILSTSAAHADTPYPNKPIRLIVGFPPGGSVDNIARIFGEVLASKINQTVYVENRPGAGTTIAADYVARSEADGYTLYVGGVGVMGGDNALYPSLHYAATDFRPITQLTRSPMVLVTGAKSKIKSVDELIFFAKKAPDVVTVSSSGAGAPTHLAAALFNEVAGVKMLHIPYKGGSQSIVAIAAGEVDVSFATPQSVMSLLAGGKIKALAVTAATNNPAFSGIPTFAKTKIPDYQFATWWGLYAPAKTPESVVQKLFAASAEALKSEALQKKLLIAGEEVKPSASPNAFKAFAESDSKANVELIRVSGARID